MSKVVNISVNAENEKRHLIKSAYRKVGEWISKPKVSLAMATVPIAIALGSVAYAVTSHDNAPVAFEGGVISSIMYVPQAYKSLKTRSTGDLSPTTLSMGLGSSAMWVTYGAMIGAAPLWGATAAIFGLTAVTASVKMAEMLRDTESRRQMVTASVPLIASAASIAYTLACNKAGIVGAEAGVASTVTFIPQAYRSIKTKSTGDISIASLSISVGVSIAWAAYGFMIHSPPVWGSEVAGMVQTAVISSVKVGETLADVKRLPEGGSAETPLAA